MCGEWFGAVGVFGICVCLVVFCFFKTFRTVFGLMSKTRAVYRMPLPFVAIFTINSLV
jgi:hypothetical protein